ncbi:acyl-CoA thioesterase [Sediminibacterium ginsengisoli]|uniref:Acyl-CoA thioester hydrolase n=1 Tax=Sediminibacterium ginsengisoli TaxID=413434 RepID=A0A1T4PLK3_9BACT|nr:thioesterase family protein [Sediminibacterium ginsengisoli]SJZ92372.1 acyl-CoA thioester hydrolase [Sediminibacterium ginsengisoli]
MYEHFTTVRVRYAETDQMDIVYYGNYAQYFEVGRTESIRDLGFTYKEMEAMGVRMPVVEMEAKYLRPAHYDDLITIKTIIRELPDSHAITFYNEVYNEKKKLLTTGKVVLFFMDIHTGKRTNMPQQLRDTLASYFESN